MPEKKDFKDIRYILTLLLFAPFILIFHMLYLIGDKAEDIAHNIDDIGEAFYKKIGGKQ